MDGEIQLISDGDGLAVLGSSTDVEQFLASAGLSSDRRSPRLGAAVSGAASAVQAGAEIAANSGRWVKLTKDSAKAVKQYGLMDSKTPGVKHAMIGKPGDIKQWIQIAKAPGSMVNPAMLANVAGVMTQLAMQQSMDEITDYLARIDEKLDDLIRAQTNAVLARMDGIDLAIREAMSVRETVGRVSDVTWSKVQGSSATILETQGFAFRQLRDLTEKVEKKTKIGDLADAAKDVEVEVQKWLAVLARCFQLHDAIAVLELDRVLDTAPDELDRHRLGLKAARRDRLELISQSTELLLERMDAAVGRANSKVLLHPSKSPAVVESSNRVAADVHSLRGLLGIESGPQATEARRWTDAASERWGQLRETGAEGVGAVRQFGDERVDQAKLARDRISGRLAERRSRSRDDEKRGE